VTALLRKWRAWPVRWRIAAVSAGLTLVILLCFALIVGKLANDRLRGDFEDELLAKANQASVDAVSLLRANQLDRFTELMSTPGDELIKVVNQEGQAFGATRDEPFLGRPTSEVTEVGSFLVASRQIGVGLGQPIFLQYAESEDDLEQTIARLWLLLGLGVLGGSALALLAGLAVANRAMQPISGLTAAAREIAMTRDPSVRLPEPEPGSEDEVAELARTLVQMLRELDAARTEREQMIQAQREFVADASHELRTPLTSILANLELLEERLERRGDDRESSEIVAGALGSSRRMRRLVSDLLLLARADTGRAGPQRDCDLAEITDAALAEVRPVAGDHELRSDIARPLPMRGNPDDLHRLIANLLENAVRHTPGGTTIELSVRAAGGRAVLTVSDDGPGLPDGVGDQIFSRFVRGTGGPADVALDSGTGLGLAIVRAVAVAHGGSVQAGGSERGGARFVVELPLAERPAPVAEPVA
jgi:two-component system, OmpR family, sensor kinase